MTGRQGAKGHPLVALVAVLAGWTGGRATDWKSPAQDLRPSYAPLVQARQNAPVTGFVLDERQGPQSPGFGFSVPGVPPETSGAAKVAPARMRHALNDVRRTIGENPPVAAWRSSGALFDLSGLMDPGRRGEPPPGQLARRDAAVPPAPVQAAFPSEGLPTRQRRWSMDAWALLRGKDGGALSPGVLPGTYGASQSGAVMRYRIDLSSPHRPAAYVRTSTALGGTAESTAALGLSARPFPKLPLVAAAEGRWTRFAGGSVVQPALFAYSEIPPIPLAGALQAETYFQGGYVAGRFPTAFVDGQVRVDRNLLRIGGLELRAGGGAWGGAQTGVMRLDVGPSATMAMPLGRGMFGRVSADWRFRVAGNARPGSGPAVTVSAGF